jgi:hypothetical protein
VCWRSTTAAATRDVAWASRCRSPVRAGEAETKKTKTRSSSSSLSGAKGYGPMLGYGLGLGLGLFLGCHGQAAAGLGGRLGKSGEPIFSSFL